MKCTFKSIKPDGRVAHGCDGVAITMIDPEIIDACNIYWASTTTKYQWTIGPAGVCIMHATNIQKLSEILEEGSFDKICVRSR